MELSPLEGLDLGDGTKLGSVPSLQGLDFSNLQMGEPVRGKARMMVRFYWKNEPEIYATEVKINPKTGATTVLKSDIRTVKREMVEIVIPGEKNIVDDRVSQYHREEFYPQYKAFREGKSAPTGTPIEQVEFLEGVPAIALELKVKGCQTLEQLAAASDFLCGQIADGFLYREFAKTAVKAQSSNKNLAQVNALKSELDEVKKQLSQLLNAQGKPFEQEEEVESEDEAPRVIITNGPERRKPGRKPALKV